MATSSIIILTILVIVIGFCIVVFSGPSILFYQIEKAYQKFLNDKENFSDDALHELQADLDRALDQVGFMMSNQKNFISGNSNEYSEYATETLKAKTSLDKNKEREARFEGMMQEVNREITRREHAHKYK